MLVHPVYRTVTFVARMMFRELFDGDILGDENIPRHGPAIVACNHLSYFDPPFVGGAIFAREAFSLARSSLFRTKFRRWLFRGMNCIPLDRGSADVGAIRAAMRTLGNGKCVMIFPEGTRSVDGGSGRAMAGVGLLACRTGAPVIPCGISGTFEIMGRRSKFFDWNRRCTVAFGEPLLFKNFHPELTSGERNRLATDAIMAAVGNLKSDCIGENS
jgi:1-acyl-sn-glycerol-3-phosphate acyltransferase